MRKVLFFLIVGLILFKQGKAQSQDSVMFFVKSHGPDISSWLTRVQTKDSADFSLLIKMPDDTSKLKGIRINKPQQFSHNHHKQIRQVNIAATYRDGIGYRNRAGCTA